MTVFVCVCLSLSPSLHLSLSLSMFDLQLLRSIGLRRNQFPNRITLPKTDFSKLANCLASAVACPRCSYCCCCCCSNSHFMCVNINTGRQQVDALRAKWFTCQAPRDSKPDFISVGSCADAIRIVHISMASFCLACQRQSQSTATHSSPIPCPTQR